MVVWTAALDYFCPGILSWTRPPCKAWRYLANALASVMFVLGVAHVMSHS